VAIAPGTYNLGPSNGKLLLKTGVEGPGAKMAHSLTIEVTNWSASATVAEDPSQSSLRLSADIPSFEVREGRGGVKPLSDNDRAEIKKTIANKILGSGKVEFQSNSVSVNGNTATVSGTVTVNGKSAPVTVNLTETGGAISGRTAVTQTALDIKPFKGPLGAFRLSDQVQVEFEGRV
jgi:polyisoprenoid-binding protein YceI